MNRAKKIVDSIKGSILKFKQVGLRFLMGNNVKRLSGFVFLVPIMWMPYFIYKKSEIWEDPLLIHVILYKK